MEQAQLLQTLKSLEKYEKNNAAVILAAYLHEWFGQFETSIIGKLLTLHAVSLVSAQDTGNAILANHIAHHLSELWGDMFNTGETA